MPVCAKTPACTVVPGKLQSESRLPSSQVDEKPAATLCRLITPCPADASAFGAPCSQIVNTEFLQEALALSLINSLH